MSKAEAERFMSAIRRSNTPAIRDFLRKLRSGGRVLGMVGTLGILVDGMRAQMCADAMGRNVWEQLLIEYGALPEREFY
jgi:hypothetical protein